MTSRTPLQQSMTLAFDHLRQAGAVMQDALEQLPHGSFEARSVRHALTLLARVRAETHSLQYQQDKQ